MIKIKRFLYYFTWTIIIGLIIYFGARYQLSLEKQAALEFNLLPMVRFISLFPIVIGILLRLPKLMIEVKEKRKWTFDWIKIVAIALPAFYIAILPILAYTPIVGHLFSVKTFMLIGSQTPITIAGVVSGYVLLDSLKTK